MTTGSAAQGALLMFFFGLGTLPMLLAIGTATGLFRRVVVHVWVRRGAGILILLFGMYTLAGLGGHAGHGGEHSGAAPASSHSIHTTH
jgi:sulfite exporter TauE/SafE